MIDRADEMSITKQAEVLKISRGSVYYLPRPVSSTDLAITRRLDRLDLEFPFAGSRILRGGKIGRRDVKTLMQRVGIEAPASAHHQARAGPQDLSVSAAGHSDHATEPGQSVLRLARQIPPYRSIDAAAYRWAAEEIFSNIQ
jgi:hypothetical protein